MMYSSHKLYNTVITLRLKVVFVFMFLNIRHPEMHLLFFNIMHFFNPFFQGLFCQNFLCRIFQIRIIIKTIYIYNKM